MKNTHTLCLAAIALACFGLSGTASAATLVSPTGVSLYGGAGSLNGGSTFVEVPGGHEIANVYDLTGLQGPLDASTLHDPYTSGTGGRIRNANAGGGAHQASVIFDLGGPLTVNGLALWNGNEDDNRSGKTLDERDKTGRGIASADFLVSVDGGTTFNAWGSSNFAREVFDFGGQAGTTVDQSYVAVGDVTAQTAAFPTVLGVTHIRADLTNHGGGNIINFNEIGFNTAAAIPEPGTFGLALVGLAGMAARRRRRT